MPDSNNFSVFHGHEYLSIKTRKKDGSFIATPVWFAQDDDTLYLTTQTSSGKVKRIRNFHDVEVAPCDRIGKLLGEWLLANAAIITNDDDRERANQLLSDKYGHTDMWKQVRRTDSTTRTFIKITSR